MTTTVRVMFDGNVLRPEQPLNLRTDTIYVITIDEEVTDEGDASSMPEHPLTQIGRLATDMGVDDLAANHDWYAHGQLQDEPRER